MDIAMLYVLLAVVAVLFLTSLVAYMTDSENVITTSCMFIAAALMWRLGNACIDGSLTRTLEATGAVNVVREATAASVFHWISIVMFLGFILQIIKVVYDSKVIEE